MAEYILEAGGTMAFTFHVLFMILIYLLSINFILMINFLIN